MDAKREQRYQTTNRFLVTFITSTTIAAGASGAFILHPTWGNFGRPTLNALHSHPWPTFLRPLLHALSYTAPDVLCILLVKTCLRLITGVLKLLSLVTHIAVIVWALYAHLFKTPPNWLVHAPPHWMGHFENHRLDLIQRIQRRQARDSKTSAALDKPDRRTELYLADASCAKDPGSHDGNVKLRDGQDLRLYQFMSSHRCRQLSFGFLHNYDFVEGCNCSSTGWVTRVRNKC